MPYHRMLLLTFLLLLGFSTLTNSLLILQAPGINLNYPNGGTVDLEFLDAFGTVRYAIKGEYLVPGYDTLAVSRFFPQRKFGENNAAIRSIRVLAGEISMMVNVYGSVTKKPAESVLTAPAMTLMLMTAVSSGGEAALTIPFDPAAVDSATSAKAVVNFPDSQHTGISSPGGFYLHQIEIFLRRSENSPTVPSLQFVPLGQLSSGGNGELAAAAQAPSSHPPDAVVLSNGHQAQPLLIQPSSQQQRGISTPPVNQFIQVPNSY